MPCSYCGKPKILALGLCAACYQRQRKNGTLQRRIGSNIGKTCALKGCSEPAIAKGFCSRHYGYTRHPLTATWQLMKSRHGDAIPEEWRQFDKFLGDVGERPHPRSQLRRIRQDRPWSKDNVRWLKPIYSQSYPPDKMRTYQHGWALRRLFGLDVETYDLMLMAQGGVCAICRGKQDINKKTGQPRRLAVDHCHETHEVRGLLCVNCNRGLGYFSDNIRRLEAAVAYLKKHEAKKKKTA